jgi:hypothetical protein
MKRFGEKIDNQWDKLPKLVQFIISWVVIIGLILLFLWVDKNYLHLPSSGTEECSGTFEHSCGDIEDVEYREDDYHYRYE